MLILSQVGVIANAFNGAHRGSTHHVLNADIIAQSKYDDYDYANDEYPPIQNRRRPSYRERTPPSQNNWLDLLKNQRQFGATLLGVGLLLTLMGIMLFFEGNLLRLGNIGIIAGIMLLIGPRNVSAFFMKESRLQATVITSIGILLVFWGRPKLGLLIEIFGLLNLFGNMFPIILAVGRSLPVIGDIIVSFEESSARAMPRRQPDMGRPRFAPEAGPGTYDPEF